MKTMKFKRAMLVLTLLVMTLSAVTGGTIAWFTDSVESKGNIIQAGNLDIEFVTDYNTNKLFDDSILWEPGYVAVRDLSIVNKGNLAANVSLTMNWTDANYIIESGPDCTLDKVIKMAVLDEKVELIDASKREEILAKVGNNWSDLASFNKVIPMETGDTKEMTLVAYWMPNSSEVDNQYNLNNGKSTVDGEALHITVGVKGEATQRMHENDSFDDTYDAGAADEWNGQTPSVPPAPEQDNPNEIIINDAAELAAFAAAVNGGETYANKTVKLAANINLAGKAWTPIGPNADAANKFAGTFDGQGNTIYNLYVNQDAGYHAAGLFGALNGTVKNLNIVGANITNLSSGGATDNGTAVVAGSLYKRGNVDNVTVTGAKVNGNRYVGGIAGYVYGNITNCTVVDSEITATPDKLTGKYDNGDKAAAIAGYFADESTYKISGNKVENVTVKGYRDIGGIVGGGTTNGSVSNNTVDGITLIADQATGHYGKKDINAAAIMGRIVSGKLGEGNTISDVNLIWNLGADLSISNAYVKDGSAMVFNGLDSLTINGNNKTLKLEGDFNNGRDWQDQYYACIIANGAEVKINNLTIDNNKRLLKDGEPYYADRQGWYTYVRGENVTYSGVTFDGGVTTYDPTTFTNCNFYCEDANMFALFLDNQYGGNKINTNLINCTLTAKGAHGNIKVADDKKQGVKLEISGCTFNSSDLEYPKVSWNASKGLVPADVKGTGNVAVTSSNNNYTFGVMANVENGGSTFNGEKMEFNTIYK